METVVLPRIVLASERADSLALLREYADFWKVPYSLEVTTGENTVIVSTDPLPNLDDDVTVVISSLEEGGFRRTADTLGVSVSSRNTSIRLPYSRDVKTFLDTTLYEFSGTKLEGVIHDGDNTVLSHLEGTNCFLLSVDLVSDYRRLLYGGLEDPPSLRFRLATKLPLSYNTIPSFIRSRSFRSTTTANEPMEEKLGPVECLRTIFLSSLVVSSGPVLRLGFWKRGISHVLTVSHDVETRRGLDVGWPNLARIERAEGIRATWNVPSNRYPLSASDFNHMAPDGEIGGHDTRHDGRLILLGLEDKVRRLRLCKSRLEQLSMGEVRGFRSPLLQHGRELIQALAEAGFRFDSSAPSWEPLSPTSLHSHGVGTVFPFKIDGVVEIPVSLPQDHQLVRVAGMTPGEAAGRLLALSNWVAGIGGVCVLLVHPDYEFAQPKYLQEYQKLLHSLTQNPGCQVMTLGELADWWDFRNRAHLVTRTNGSLELRGGSVEQLQQLTPQLVTGYGRDGFKIEAPTALSISYNVTYGDKS